MKEPTFVDFGGHSWFFKTEIINYMWRDNSRLFKTAEDIEFCASSSIYGDIKTITFGTTDFQAISNYDGDRYGGTKQPDGNIIVASSYNNPYYHYINRIEMIQHWVDKGWKLKILKPKILVCYGTRPEWIKVKSVINSFKKNNIIYKTLFTGQHKDIVEQNADYNINISQNGNRLNNIVSSIVDMPDYVFDGITHVLVQGDTTSVLSIALNSYHRNIKIIHLEAGLRTYDFENPFPEEMNRQLVSKMSSIHLCPTEMNKLNILEEKCSGDVYVVGNTVLDNLVDFKNQCEYADEILVTLHRRENHDKIEEWFRVIEDIALKNPDLKFTIPIHPNPNVDKHKYIFKKVNVIDPLSYDDFIQKLVKVKMVITDSGGLQEECSFFNKKCLVCRETTERPESLGFTSFLVGEPNNLYEMFNKHINDFEVNEICPFGNGDSSKKIVNIIKNIK
jgi:UDP-N-acetylglucosamine 2-epimerase (non-hydrolysing)